MIKNILLVLPFAAILGALYMLYSIYSDKKNWETSPTSPVADIEKRSLNRGTLVSVVSAIILSVVGGIMASMSVPENMIVTNYGFLLGPVIGYMLDMGIGTDDGYSKFSNMGEWIQFIFSSLITSNFLRYIVTVLLDLFISDPIQDVMRAQITPVREELKAEGGYSAIVADNVPAILQSIVGFITFSAYTNQTRFNWAYPSELLPLEDRMSPFVVSLATAVAGCLYLVHNQNAEDIGTKIIYVVVAIGLLYVMNSFEISEAPTDKQKTDSKKTFVPGLALFSLFAGYGLVWPLMNAGGDSGSSAADVDFSKL
tara:strand:+ start:703 stop:1638 length:936 start_codon:yes stop_codon:yes gene_type:complete